MFLQPPSYHLSPRWGLSAWELGVPIHLPPLWGSRISCTNRNFNNANQGRNVPRKGAPRSHAPSRLKHANERSQAMINGRAALLRIVTCVIGSGIFLLLSLLFFPINWDSHGNVWVSGVHLSGSRPYGLSALEIVGIGALLGLLPGIAWRSTIGRRGGVFCFGRSWAL